MKNKIFLIIFFSALISNNLFGQSAPANTTTNTPAASQPGVEQKRETSTYYNDPFSEIDTSEDEEYEESLDRFYAFGRMLHLSLYGQFLNIRGPMADIYKSGAMGGFRISYFIDWDVAFIFGFSLGSMSVSIPNVNPVTSGIVNPITGSATIANIELGLKYYINFYDISKPIAYINPAILAGVELSIIRDQIDQEILTLLKNYSITNPAHRSVAPGLFAGMSLEFPIFRKSIYLGGEFMYHFSFFPSTNPVVLSTDPHFGWINYSGNYMTFGLYLTWNL
ncbi:MAG: hypothetical protein NTY22_03145 [Proteobacteria bacterium]|nr:hypothetical protein [Pseudomonadota bacterium]